jgi:MYXO-CTERM domain-containing protein
MCATINWNNTMKSTLKTLSAATLGALALSSAGTAGAAVSLTGASLVWAEDSTTNPSSFADTLGGNGAWNIYVRPVGGAFVNSGDGASTAIDIPLSAGVNEFELWVHHESWGDNTVTNPGSYLNLFLGDRSGPAISARLSGGNFGNLAPLTTDQVALVPNVSDGALVAPASQLSFTAPSGDIVTLNSMSISTAADTVSAFNGNPTGVSQDTVFAVSVSVTPVPEPSTGLLGLLGASLLLFRRRR